MEDEERKEGGREERKKRSKEKWKEITRQIIYFFKEAKEEEIKQKKNENWRFFSFTFGPESIKRFPLTKEIEAFPQERRGEPGNRRHKSLAKTGTRTN